MLAEITWGPHQASTTATDVDRQIRLSISSDVQAKLAGFADRAVVRVIGLFRAPAGAQPSIEVQDITQLNRLDGAAESH